MPKEILVNQKIYPLEVVFGTAYIFLEKCYVFLDKHESGKILVRLRPKPECSAEDFERVAGEFENELINQALRRKIAQRTETVRDAIVHRALFSSLPESLDLSLEDEQGDYLDDPLGIAVPWEEKFKKEEAGTGTGTGSGGEEPK
jgi:His-Xaa-Ser system protein HxsD